MCAELSDSGVMKLTQRLALLSPAQLLAGREWCAECAACGVFHDVDGDWIMNEATDLEIVAEVARTFDGGWPMLLASLELVNA